jgi:hypothetical protein
MMIGTPSEMAELARVMERFVHDDGRGPPPIYPNSHEWKVIVDALLFAAENAK